MAKWQLAPRWNHVTEGHRWGLWEGRAEGRKHEGGPRDGDIVDDMSETKSDRATVTGDEGFNFDAMRGGSSDTREEDAVLELRDEGGEGAEIYLVYRVIKKPPPPRNTRHLSPSSKKSAVAVAIQAAAAAAHLTLLLIPPLLARSLACLNEPSSCSDQDDDDDDGATVGIIPNYRRTRGRT